MNALLLIYIPIIASIVWASYRVYKRMNRIEALLVVVIGIIVVSNGIIRHFELSGYRISDAVMLLQQIMASLIVPCTYTYFSRQTGMSAVNGVSIHLFALMAFLVFPNIVVFIDGSQTASDVGYMTFVIVGRETHVYTIADFIIVLQSAITAARVLPLYRKIKRYGLSLSDDVKRFMTWWCCAIVFVAFATYHSEAGDYDLRVDVSCRIGFMLLVTRAFYKIGMGFDLRPILSEDKEPVELDEFVNQSRELAKRLSVIIESGDVLSMGYSSDDAILALGTNRTYFFRMVKAEFGCTFSELMNRERVKNVKNLLVSTDCSVSEVALRCGFSNSSYMTKVFKQLEGCTPSEYRDRRG